MRGNCEEGHGPEPRSALGVQSLSTALEVQNNMPCPYKYRIREYRIRRFPV